MEPSAKLSSRPRSWQQRRTGRKLGRVLADLGFMSESSLLEFLSKHLQVPVVDLKHAKVDQETVKLLAEPLARRYRAIVLLKDARGLLVGMADPSDLHAYDELQAKLKQPIRLALVGEAELLKTLDAVYRQTDEIASLAEAVRDDLRANDVDIEQLSAEESSPDAPVIKLLQTMFNDAVQARASDIHIEPGEQKLRIRLRVDGVLQEQVIDGRRVASALVTRLKLMSGLDISEKRLPQDGRFSIRCARPAVDVRLATMPTSYGESVVMRLLKPVDRAPVARAARHAGDHRAALSPPGRAQLRHGARDRTDRQRQDHDAVRGAQPHQPARA